MQKASLNPLSKDNAIPAPNYKSNLANNYEIIETMYDTQKNMINIYEFEDIENFLNNWNDVFQKNFEKQLETDCFTPKNTSSKCLLNSKYSEITKKVYINEIVSCKGLIDSKMDKNFKECIEVFGYSMKYYMRLLSDIRANIKKESQSDEEYSKSIVVKFYNNTYEKINFGLNQFYSKMFINDINYPEHKLKKLIELNDLIYEEKQYSLKDMCHILKLLPIKYLNIYIVGIDKITLPLDTTKLSEYGFFFDYSNNFIRYAINKIIKSYSPYQFYQLGGSAFGADFEDKINEKLSELVINNEKVDKRNVFTLIGPPNKEYIKKLREAENSEFHNFYNLKVLDVLIDGYDLEEIKSTDFDIRKKNVFIHQISKCGQSFDAAILIKNSDNNKNSHDLCLFQDTINKIIIKSKLEYCSDGNKCKNNLENIYENLSINKIYFMFVLPHKFDDTAIISKLKSNNIHYIFFDIGTKYFISKELTKIVNFRIPEAELSFKKDDFIFENVLSNIKTSKAIINLSIRNYLGKKRLYSNKFINVYNKICEDNNFNCIKIDIPIKLKSNILLILYKKNIFKEGSSINFIPSINCKITDLQKIFSLENNMFIFSDGHMIFLYYYSYYKINEDYSIVETSEFTNVNKITNFKIPTSNLNIFFDALNYPFYCFGFNVIINHNFN